MRLGIHVLAVGACLIPCLAARSPSAHAEGARRRCSFEQEALETRERAETCSFALQAEPVGLCTQEVLYGNVPFCLRKAPSPAEPAVCSIESEERDHPCSYSREGEMVADAYSCSVVRTTGTPFLDRR